MGKSTPLAGGPPAARWRRLRRRHIGWFATVVSLLGCGSRAFADGGAILPASATPMGYSLLDLAADTALYNTGAANLNPDTPAPPDIPFNIITYTSDHTLQPNTYSYVPITFCDNSNTTTDPNFPDPTDQQADAAYYDALTTAGGYYLQYAINIDGQVTPLTDDYIAGVSTPPLLDGGGNSYIVQAVVLTPFSVGDHDITVGLIDSQGYPVYEYSYDITVVPEPIASTCSATLGAGWLLRRHRKRG